MPITSSLPFSRIFSKVLFLGVINPLPDMPKLGAANSAPNKDMTSKL